MEELLEARAKRLNLERKKTVILRDFLDLEDEELAEELAREAELLASVEASVSSLEENLSRSQKQDVEDALADEGGILVIDDLQEQVDALKPLVENLLSKLRDGLGVVTVKDSHELWELEQAANAFERAFYEVVGE